MKGRKPKPTALKRLQGTARRHRLRVDEPQPPPPGDDVDTPPALIAGDPIAAAEWRRVRPILTETCVITAADTGALLAACVQWSLWVRMSARAEAEHHVTTRGTGATGIAATSTIAWRALQTLLKLWVELGLTPSARSRVGAVPPSATDDPWAEFDEPMPLGPQRPPHRH